jgi:hypothetical protein
VEENNITFPILFDPGSPGGVQGGETYDMYYLPNDGSPYPRDFIIDQQGIIQYANNEIDTQWMIDIITSLLENDCNIDVQGDINSDGYLNVLDIVSMVNIILLTTTPTDCEVSIADVNFDGAVNVLDIVQVVNWILQ